jgi:hypothetical protein
MIFLLGVNDTPSLEERNPCASALPSGGMTEHLEYPQLRGDPEMGNPLDHGKIFWHGQDLPGGDA